MPGRWLHVGKDGATSLPPGWSDEIVAHTFKDNKDGTVTIVALINLYTPDGKCYSTDKVMRLELKQKRTARP